MRHFPRVILCWLIYSVQLATIAAWNSHCRHVAGHVVLLDTLLSSLEDRKAHWALLYRISDLGGRGRPGFGWIPEDGRSRWPGWIPMDVPAVRCRWFRRRYSAALLAPRPTSPTRRSAFAIRLAQVHPPEQASVDGRRCQDPLRGSDPSLQPPDVDYEGYLAHSHRLEALPLSHHVLWRCRSGQRCTGLCYRHHSGYQPQIDWHSAQSPLRPNLACKLMTLDRGWF
jgi:hypothetical protein